jgi:hypothetical protein
MFFELTEEMKIARDAVRAVERVVEKFVFVASAA